MSVTGWAEVGGGSSGDFLEPSPEQLQTALTLSGAGVVSVTAGGEARWCRTSHKLHALDGERCSGPLGALLLRLEPADRAGVEATLLRCAERSESCTVDYRIRAPGGGHSCCQARAIPAPGGGLLVVVREVTTGDGCGRLGQLRSLFELAADGIFVSDQQFRILDVNDAACRMTGYPREELLLLTIRDVFPPDELRGKPLENTRLMSGATVRNERRLLRRDGTLVHIETSARMLPDGRFQALARDITERRRMEAQLVASDRMATIGLLAAGTAHEINNPLAYVVTNLDLLERALATPDQAAVAPAFVAEARDGAFRVAAIVRDLKLLSRVQDDDPATVELGRVIDSATNLARSELRRKATLVLELGALPQVQGSEARLCQVILNLLLNAAGAFAEAEPARNTVTVAARTDAEGRAVIEVRDTGCGIPPELHGKIFDPFFTTKPAGVGTGLGLSICRSIVTAHGGTLELESEVGRGTTFRVILPPAQRQGPSPELPGATDAQFPSGLRILVIEDEAALARALARGLAEHEVTLAAGGREGLALALAGEFDALVCDLVMPGFSGVDLYEALCRERPALASRVVVISGGAVGPRERELLARHQGPALAKPFGLDALRAALGVVVARERRA